jgi:ATP-dependent DNA helicase RecQ
MECPDLLSLCLSLDLESTPDGKIFRIGATFRGVPFEKKGRFNLKEAILGLDQFGSGAEFILGHNLLGHDLPLLETQFPDLQLLTKPVIDTLYLSPLAFPENPYHRLVKDYKLVRESVNDPVADARLAASIFADQWERFVALRDQSAEVLDFYRFCFENSIHQTVRGEGIASVFQTLGARPLEIEGALEIFSSLIADKVCRTAMRTVSRQYLWDPEESIALAYCTAWLRVSGHNSVLPPWVRQRFPRTVPILKQLREVPCEDPTCAYCRQNHDPARQLERYFGFPAYRPLPKAPDGSSLQEAVVRHGMGDRPQLAILPTGGGKSLCFQVPALVRNYRRGVLTIVISPLQALMKDQVDNLIEKTGTPFAAALYGMLTPPERGQVLEAVRLGDVAILYVSPEQLRNRSFREAISQREIGCWVFDEAHCLSKWGHDFRTDYLYAARFIREFSKEQKVPMAPVACFTATAKKSVREEIVDYFQRELGQELRLFEGGVDRDNLQFEVQTVSKAEKYERIHQLINERVPQDGSAVVYAATRSETEEISEYLVKKGISSAAFHAGLPAPEKRQIQEAFIAGGTQVICATNAFGMGIDKDNVRLVVHADIPGSLDNYLQEAGRAGRDQQPAECLLLYDEQDIETQFKVGALSELSHRDIAQILRGLRRAKKNKAGEIVLTAGEILRSDEVETSFDSSDRSADTKVRTAVAWLERAGFVERNLNNSSVFQGRPAVRNLEEAQVRIDALDLPARIRRRWLAVLRVLINANPDEGMSADQLAELPEFLEPKDLDAPRRVWVENDTQRVLKTLNDMAEVGLIKRDLLLTAFVRYKVGNHSQLALERVRELETAMLKLMQAEEPDGEGWLHLSLRRLNQRLLDEGFRSVPQLLLALLTSLSRDGKGLAGQRGSLDLFYLNQDHYRVKLQRDWEALVKTAQRRSELAKLLLDAIFGKIPEQTPASGELLVEFSLDDLIHALRGDLFMAGQVKNPLAAVERALMFLHEQKIITLQQGLAVFRQAMTIRLLENKRRYSKGDYSPLEQHYRERTFQVHVMNEYARLGLEKIKQALGLVTAYFAMDKKEFVNRFFAGRKEVLERATSQDSYRRIVDNLENPAQVAIVAAPTDENMLVLAGPGSGKTRVVVHRCAYLLRVMRVPARSVLILCFNRQAASALRRRLWDLVGSDAVGVTVLTYHGLAMRLTGTSFADRLERACEEGVDFDALIDQALRLLRGEEDFPGLGRDELRDRLLAGYQHILVDEYQDIDQRQYDLVSALAGRTQEDPEAKLTIMAVGDDDQNIYAFRGANVQFIRQFQDDYQAKFHYLVENFRSSAHIIAAGNALIAQNRDRMKTEQPIRINKGRDRLEPGEPWTHLDPFVQGRVQLLRVPDRGAQAAAIVRELERLRRLNPAVKWSECAVLARTHEGLATVRAALEFKEIPVWHLGQELSLPIGRIREIVQFTSILKTQQGDLRRAGDLETLAAEIAVNHPGNPWWALLQTTLQAWHTESGNAELPVAQALEFLWEALAEQKRERFASSGVFLSTVHAAKGTEFDHVLLFDDWALPNQGDLEEQRRAYYVGMTRARQTLCLLQDQGAPNPFGETLAAKLEGEQFLVRAPAPGESLPEGVLRRRYEILGLRDLYLDYAGRLSGTNPIHQQLEQLQTGETLGLRLAGAKIEVVNPHGAAVARLSKQAEERWRPLLGQVESLKVLALIERRVEDDREESYRKMLKAERWEVPVVEVVYRNW